MICITGDTHGDISRFKNPVLKKLRKLDSFIICGDFGFLWNGDKNERKILKWIGKRKYNVLFAEGLHENFDELEKYETEYWCGGLTRKISGNLRQLINGQVYELSGCRIFVFGGGVNDDLDFNAAHATQKIQEREAPDDDEFIQQIKPLGDNGNKVDFIVTYEPPATITEFIDIGKTDRNKINTFLDRVRDTTEFRMWYFGRHHVNKIIPPKFRALFDDVVVAEDSVYKDR